MYSKHHKEIYTPISEIKSEIKKRWENKELKDRVEKYLGENLINILKLEPRAVFSRSIITPNRELEYFLDIVGHSGLKPIFFEYYGKLVSKNKDSHHLGKLLFDSRSKNQNSKVNIINFNKSEGEYLDKIKTMNGQSLIEFHRSLLKQSFPEIEDNIFNITDWFNKTRTLSSEYYFYFLSLFVCHGVLFDNFLLEDKNESIFFKEKVLPSFKKVEEVFGVKPLIFPLLPTENEKEVCWLCYPESIKDNIIGNNK